MNERRAGRAERLWRRWPSSLQNPWRSQQEWLLIDKVYGTVVTRGEKYWLERWIREQNDLDSWRFVVRKGELTRKGGVMGKKKPRKPKKGY